MALVSPGVEIQIIDDTISASGIDTAVPLVFIATGSNKTTSDGSSTAEGTLPENAGKLNLVTSQRELLTLFGVPYFRKSDGSTVLGDEISEWGLLAAYHLLGISNRAYVVRADLDINQLLPTETAPTGRPVNGTYWFDFLQSSFGVFVANGRDIPGLAWDSVVIIHPTTADIDPVTGIPSPAFGFNGQHAVVTSFNDNIIYEKIGGNWLRVGSTAWKTAKPTKALGTVSNPVGAATTTNIEINGVAVTIANAATLSTIISSINTAAIPNITASMQANKLLLTNTVGGDINLVSAGTGLSDLGFEATYGGVKLIYDTHIKVPDGSTIGSIWIKTTNPNKGANYTVRRFNSSLDQFVSVYAPLYANDTEADLAFGLSKATGTLYVQYNILGTISDPIASHSIKRWNGSQWEILDYIASRTAPTSTPLEGTLWYNAALEADIMVNTGNQWRGYRNVYPATDPNGPQMTSEEPTSQSTGAPLANYDLWIDTDQVLDYPKIYRYLGGEWVLLDNDDKTTPFGVIFADVRENSGPVGPWIRGGYAATATSTLKASFAYVKNPGDGYTDGTYTCTVLGGNTVASNATSLSVVVAGGEVLSVTVLNAGRYSALPSGGSTVKVSGIAGLASIEAEFSINWIVDTITVTSGGAGYTNNPIISIVGGGGIGATAFTTVVAGAVTTATVINGGVGYTSIPQIIINTPFGQPESTSVADMSVSDWNDPVELDLYNPQLFPAGMILFNTRRSTNTVKVWRPYYFRGIANYTVGNFLSDAYEASNPGARAAAYTYLETKPARWVNFSGKDTREVALFGRFAQRICVIRALAEQIIGNQDVRAEELLFNLLVAPGYTELLDELQTLNVDKKETAFIIADTPIDLTSSATNIEAWATNRNNAASNGRQGRTTLYDYAAQYYGWGLSTNVDGFEVIIPPSAIALRTYAYSDSVTYEWWPPAGTRRGVVSNAASVGYVDLRTRQYTPVKLNNGQRDTLYINKINPIANIPRRGLLVFGNKTISPNDNSALSRVNVARLVCYIRRTLPPNLYPFLFELNLPRVRRAAMLVVEDYFADLVSKEAIYDFAVSLERNTDATIAKNELWIDATISPTRAIEFIYIPITLSNKTNLS